MPKTIHFLSGLPRSCSTLLANILAQNPRVHATPTSQLHEIGYIARKVFQTDEVKSMDSKVAETMYFDYVRGGCAHAFDSVTDRPVVVDKCRSWVGHLDQTFKVWPNAKVLVPVRDIRGILSSMEKKRIQHPSPFNGFEEANPANFTTIDKRAQGWLSSAPVGIAVERIYEAAQRFKDRLLFVHAEELTSDPATTMKRIWSYLGEEDFKGHDFDNIEQYTKESEVGWPYGDHTIRGKVEVLKPDWFETLGRQLSEALSQKFSWVNNL